MKKVLLTFLCTLMFPALALAQGVTTSSMRGSVVDDAGMPLPGASVVAIHIPSGTDYGTATNTEGSFNLRNLRVGGPYQITISFVGYKNYVRDGIQLKLGETFQVTAQMVDNSVELGEVTVMANRSVFDANRNGVETVIGEEALNDVPTMGRDFADFARLTPQAYVENDDDDGPAISIAGQNNRFNSIFIDGAVNNDVFGLSAQGTNGGQTGSTPISLDAIEELQIALSPFDVTQSGFTGGAINAVTRSGTNDFSGSLYYFMRNQNLVGKTPFILLDDGDEATKLPEFTSNRFGVRIAGPVIKNKLFFFANVEILRSETPLPFSATYVGDSFNRLGEISEALKDRFNYDPGEFGDKTGTLDDDKYLLKLDWNISRNHKLSARHSYADASNIDQFASSSRTISFSNGAEVFPSKTHSTAVELNSMIGDNMANKLVIGFTKVDDDRGFAGDPFPSVEINDGNGTIFLGSEAFSTANILNQEILTITNNFNIFQGKHTLTIGTHNEFYKIANLFIPQNFGAYEYDSVSDFLSSVNGTPVAPDVYQRGYSLLDDIAGDGTSSIGAFDAYQLGLYVQDEFQATDALRLTFGVRVDVPKVTTKPLFAPDAVTNTIPAVAAAYDLEGALPGVTPKAAAYLSPRIGFNYDFGTDSRAQLRGGIGVFTGRVPFVWPGSMFLNNGTNSGFVFDSDGKFPNGDPIPFVGDVNNQFTASTLNPNQTDIPSGRLEIFTEDFRYPRVMRSSLGVDYELPAGAVLSVEGQYTKTLSGVNVTNVNLNPNSVVMTNGPGARPVYSRFKDDVEIDDRYSAIHVVGNTSEGYTYDMTARLSKMFDLGGSDALRLDVGYTYGDAYVVNDGTSSQINTLWRSMEISDHLPNALALTRSDFSIGHRVIAGVTLQKELFDNANTSLTLFYTGESGRPFNYTIDNSDDLIGAPGWRDFGLLYVPNNTSELDFSADSNPAAAAAALDAFIESSPYLSSRRGQFAERNGSRLPAEHIVDLKLSQEVMGFEVTLDIFNFTNLLNKNWGVRYNKYTSSSNGGNELIEFRGFKNAAGGDYTPTYRLEFDPDETPTEQAFFDDFIKDSGTFTSRWFMQLGFRFSF